MSGIQPLNRRRASRGRRGSHSGHASAGPPRHAVKSPEASSPGCADGNGFRQRVLPQAYAGQQLHLQFHHHQLDPGLAFYHPPQPSPAVLPPRPLYHAASSPQGPAGTSSGTKPKGTNPLRYWSKQFQDYRGKQGHKEPGSSQKWPEAFENAFLDALLLVPVTMGRRKYFMNGKQYGRNMLIGEYILLSYMEGLCAGEAGLDGEEGNKFKRERKQVSSHMQVVKAFYAPFRCFHFLFPLGQCSKRAKAYNYESKDDEEGPDSFKHNRVFSDLAHGRLPTVRPNYEYFDRLLNLQSLIVLAPKTNWLFVSCGGVRKKSDGTVHGPDGAVLDPDDFPHMARDGARDGTAKRILGSNTLIHEFCREVKQQEATSVGKLYRHWQERFPAMADALRLPARDEDCVLYEADVTLDVSSTRCYPAESCLQGVVEMKVVRAGMEGHRWSCLTWLSRPAVLCGDGPHAGQLQEDPHLFCQECEISPQTPHRAGCHDGKRGCRCLKDSHMEVRLPFLVEQWKEVVLEHSRVRRDGGGGGGDKGKGRGKKKGGTRRGKDDDDDAPSIHKLLGQVAMLQEVYSSPNPADLPGGQHQWKRHAIIMYKFSTLQQGDDDDDDDAGKPDDVKAGTVWRYLTVADPNSAYHKMQMYANSDAAVPPPPPAADNYHGHGGGILDASPPYHGAGLRLAIPPRAAVPPTPSASYHASAATSRSFGSPWDTPAVSPRLHSQQQFPRQHYYPPHHHHYHLQQIPSAVAPPVHAMVNPYSGVVTPPHATPLQGPYHGSGRSFGPSPPVYSPHAAGVARDNVARVAHAAHAAHAGHTGHVAHAAFVNQAAHVANAHAAGAVNAAYAVDVDAGHAVDAVGSVGAANAAHAAEVADAFHAAHVAGSSHAADVADAFHAAHDVVSAHVVVADAADVAEAAHVAGSAYGEAAAETAVPFHQRPYLRFTCGTHVDPAIVSSSGNSPYSSCGSSLDGPRCDPRLPGWGDVGSQGLRGWAAVGHEDGDPDHGTAGPRSWGDAGVLASCPPPPPLVPISYVRTSGRVRQLRPYGHDVDERADDASLATDGKLWLPTDGEVRRGWASDPSLSLLAAGNARHRSARRMRSVDEVSLADVDAEGDWDDDVDPPLPTGSGESLSLPAESGESSPLPVTTGESPPLPQTGTAGRKRARSGSLEFADGEATDGAAPVAARRHRRRHRNLTSE